MIKLNKSHHKISQEVKIDHSYLTTMTTESIDTAQLVNNDRSEESIPSAGDDFYLHVNKSWLDDPANKIPGDYESWGGFVKLHDTCLNNQINLVKGLCDKTDRTDEEEKIVALWNACIRRFQSWRDDTAVYDPIVRELEILDAYLVVNKPLQDTTDLVTRYAEYLHYSQLNCITNIYDFDKGSDLLNSNNVVLDFATSGISLPSREYYFDERFAEKRQMFRVHLENVSRIIEENTTVQLGEDFVQNVIDFETAIARLMMSPDQARSYDEYFTNTTLTELHQKVNELNSLQRKQDNYSEEERDLKLSDDQVEYFSLFMERLYELFDYRRILAENREKTYIQKNVTDPPHLEQITVYDGDAIRRVFVMLLDKDMMRKYRSYLQYNVITAYKSFCTKVIDEEYFDFYSRKLRGQLEQKSEEKRAIQTVNSYAGEMLGKVYVSKYFPESCKEDIKNSIFEILDIMRVSIQKNDWLTLETKQKALDKLSKFSVKIGYPDVWKDYSKFDIKDGDDIYIVAKKATKWGLDVNFFSKLNTPVDKYGWLMTPQTVNAYFMPTQNEIVFPAAILQPPFYFQNPDEIDFDINYELTEIKAVGYENYNFTQAANFGGICAVIAHEITHGYDDQGRKFDGDGNLNDWWTEEDIHLFTTKTQLMETQASSYTFVDSSDNDKVYKMNPKLTTGENLADLGGISLALQALASRLKKTDCSPVEIAMNYRVMFKSFANIWKQNIKRDSKINRLTTDPHAPSEFRAKLVRNMQEFYDVFSVSEKDAMYIKPEERVRMW